MPPSDHKGMEHGGLGTIRTAEGAPLSRTRKRSRARDASRVCTRAPILDPRAHTTDAAPRGAPALDCEGESDDGGISVQSLLDLRDAITLLEGIDSSEAWQRLGSPLD